MQQVMQSIINGMNICGSYWKIACANVHLSTDPVGSTLIINVLLCSLVLQISMLSIMSN